MLSGSEGESLARSALSSFSKDHGERFFEQSLQEFAVIFREISPSSRRGGLLVLAEYMRNLSGGFLKTFAGALIDMISQHLFAISDDLLLGAVVAALQVIAEKIEGGVEAELKLRFAAVFTRIRRLEDQGGGGDTANVTMNDSRVIAEHENYLRVFKALCSAKSEVILAVIVPEIFLRPISAGILEVITNNAGSLAKQLVYSPVAGRWVLSSV